MNSNCHAPAGTEGDSGVLNIMHTNTEVKDSHRATIKSTQSNDAIAVQSSMEENVRLYINMAYLPEDIVEIRCIAPNHIKLSLKRSWGQAYQIIPSLPTLARANLLGYGVFVGVLPRHDKNCGRANEVVSSRVVFCDFDHVESSNYIQEVISAVGLPQPTMLVDSGHGFHSYWQLTSPITPGEFAGMQSDLAALLGSDPVVKDPCRIMRLPGFMNTKLPEKPCHIIDIDAERVYDWTTLRHKVPLAIPKKRTRGPAIRKARALPPAQPISPEEEQLNIPQAKKLIDRITGGAPGLRRSAAYRVACVLANDFAFSVDTSLALLEQWDADKNNPTIMKEYGKEELMQIIHNATCYAKGERGFRRISNQRRGNALKCSILMSIL